MKDANEMVNNMTATVPDFLAIKEGMPYYSVKKALGLAFREQFSISTDNGNYTMSECVFSGGNSIMFMIFKDQKLIKVINPRLPDLKTLIHINQAGLVSEHVMEAPEMELIAEAVQSPALTSEQIAEYLRPHSEGRDGDVPVALLSIYNAVSASRIKKDLQVNIDLLQRFDGSLASLGMTTAEIEKLYGKSTQVMITKDGLTAWLYQNGHATDIGYPLAYVGLGIVFDHSGRVSAIYDDTFFPDEWRTTKK